jgi:hypothetical protein
MLAQSSAQFALVDPSAAKAKNRFCLDRLWKK